MPPEDTIKVISLEEYMGFIEAQSAKVLWYRGLGDASHELKPGLYRHRTKKDVGSLYKLEWEFLERFKQRSIPFLPRSIDNDWGYLFLMQHHGVPTRLIDWTENAYIALYFALADAKIQRDSKGKLVYDRDNKPVYDKTAVVWVLNPDHWNKTSLSGDHGVVSSSHQLVKNAYPVVKEKPSGKSLPVALYGDYNSARIVAQRGVFTIFGTDPNPMEEMYEYENEEFEPGCLRKLLIPPTAIGNLFKTLGKIGVTDSMAFPNLDGLAKEMKRKEEFPV